MALAATTGSPPAVTHEQVEAWSKLAEDVTAALIMGGQKGLDFLIAIMPEWCEAVDDVNTARRVCIDLAGRGLRHEAIEWHAKGFFDVANQLDPARPGWDDWEAELQDHGIVTPRMDAELGELANGIQQDLANPELASRLVQLRRNVLQRGHLGERLVLLESIRKLDPASPVWQEMISPIRRQRVDMIAGEVTAAIAKKDLEALAWLRDEVDSQDWGDDLPDNVAKLLDATGHWESLDDYREQLAQAAASIAASCAEAREKPPESPAYAEAVQAADQARDRYSEIRTAFIEAIHGAEAMPEIAAFVAESGVAGAIRQSDNAIREPCVWLDHEAARAQTRTATGEIEARLLRIVESAPRKSSNREAFDEALEKWHRQAADAMEKARRATAQLTGDVQSETTVAVFKRIEDVRNELEAHSRKLLVAERRLVIGVIVGVVTVVVLLVVILAVGSFTRPPAAP